MIEPKPCIFAEEKHLRRALAGLRYAHDVLKKELLKIKNKKTSGTEAPEVKFTSTQVRGCDEC